MRTIPFSCRQFNIYVTVSGTLDFKLFNPRRRKTCGGIGKAVGVLLGRQPCLTP